MPSLLLLNVHFNIILPSKSRSSNWALSFRFLHQITVRICPPPHRSAVQNPWTRAFLDPSRQTLESTHPIQWERGTFLGVKWPGREADQSPRSSAEVKTRLELYNYSPCMSSWRREQQPFFTSIA
jgi:hypothetical protein